MRKRPHSSVSSSAQMASGAVAAASGASQRQKRARLLKREAKARRTVANFVRRVCAGAADEQEEAVFSEDPTHFLAVLASNSGAFRAQVLPLLRRALLAGEECHLQAPAAEVLWPANNATFAVATFNATAAATAAQAAAHGQSPNVCAGRTLCVLPLRAAAAKRIVASAAAKETGACPLPRFSTLPPPPSPLYRKSVAVVGGSGLLGLALVRRLLELGHQVVQAPTPDSPQPRTQQRRVQHACRVCRVSLLPRSFAFVGGLRAALAEKTAPTAAATCWVGGACLLCPRKWRSCGWTVWLSDSGSRSCARPRAEGDMPRPRGAY